MNRSRSFLIGFAIGDHKMLDILLTYGFSVDADEVLYDIIVNDLTKSFEVALKYIDKKDVNKVRDNTAMYGTVEQMKIFLSYFPDTYLESILDETKSKSMKKFIKKRIKKNERDE